MATKTADGSGEADAATQDFASPTVAASAATKMAYGAQVMEDGQATGGIASMPVVPDAAAKGPIRAQPPQLGKTEPIATHATMVRGAWEGAGEREETGEEGAGGECRARECEENGNTAEQAASVKASVEHAGPPSQTAHMQGAADHCKDPHQSTDRAPNVPEDQWNKCLTSPLIARLLAGRRLTAEAPTTQQPMRQAGSYARTRQRRHSVPATTTPSRPTSAATSNQAPKRKHRRTRPASASAACSAASVAATAAAAAAAAVAKDGRPWWERMHEKRSLVRGGTRHSTQHVRAPVGGNWRWHYSATMAEAAEAAESAAAADAASQRDAYTADGLAAVYSSSGASAFPVRRPPGRNVGVTNASVANNNSIGSFADVNVEDDSGDSSTSSYESLPRQQSTQQTGTLPVGGHALAGSVSTWKSRRPQSAPIYTAASRASNEWARETLRKLHVEQMLSWTPPLAPRLAT